MYIDVFRFAHDEYDPDDTIFFALGAEEAKRKMLNYFKKEKQECDFWGISEEDSKMYRSIINIIENLPTEKIKQVRFFNNLLYEITDHYFIEYRIEEYKGPYV